VTNGFFCALPDELLLNILSYLELSDLWCVGAPRCAPLMSRSSRHTHHRSLRAHSSARFLNKYFKRFCDDEGLWKRMYASRWIAPGEEMPSSKRKRQNWHLSYVTRHFVDRVRGGRRRETAKHVTLFAHALHLKKKELAHQPQETRMYIHWTLWHRLLSAV
jgi:hypothetical protein